MDELIEKLLGGLFVSENVKAELVGSKAVTGPMLLARVNCWGNMLGHSKGWKVIC